MRKLFLAVALATTALGATAHAEGAGPYVTVEGGVVLHDKAKVYGPSDTFERLDRFKTGWEAGGALGYDFGGFRLEAEGFYNRAYLKSQDRAPSVIAPFGYVDGSNGLRGRTTTVAAMANALFSVGKVGGVKLYAGGGAGWARTSLKEDLPGADPVRGRSNGFAWQALAGLTAPISDHIDLGVKYRYFRPDNADKFYRGTGFEQTAKLRSHSVLATLTYNFGGPKVEPIEEPV
ncbi:outer membrane protein, partial [Novosphingobium sp.]|uniref:outer membrane protein n=2 Tax=unclassified Novosphingobium TaxID=2644732 RepID=UPI0038B94F2B